jgi:hypothetical protein
MVFVIVCTKIVAMIAGNALTIGQKWTALSAERNSAKKVVKATAVAAATTVKLLCSNAKQC